MKFEQPRPARRPAPEKPKKTKRRKGGFRAEQPSLWSEQFPTRAEVEWWIKLDEQD